MVRVSRFALPKKLLSMTPWQRVARSIETIPGALRQRQSG